MLLKLICLYGVELWIWQTSLILMKFKYSNPESFTLSLLYLNMFPKTCDTDRLHTVSETVKLLYKRLQNHLHEHSNPSIANLASENLPENPFHRIQRKSRSELII